MQMRKIFGAVMLAAGLCATGCAVTEGDAADPAVSTIEDDIVVQCGPNAWLVNFYSEPALINIVGTLRCQCFRPQTRTGITTDFSALAFKRTCDLN